MFLGLTLAEEALVGEILGVLTAVATVLTIVEIVLRIRRDRAQRPPPPAKPETPPAPSPPPAPQTWPGAVQLVATVPPLPTSTEGERPWWVRHAMTPANGWQGRAPLPATPTPAPAPASSTKWWQNQGAARRPVEAREGRTT